MRSTFSFLFSAILTTSAIACSSSPTAPTEPAVVTLSPGASGGLGGLNVTFVRVTADTRCPGDALCIQPGDASVAIEINAFGPLRQSVELSLADLAKRSVARGGYTITFEALNPYPFLSQGPISPGAYRATFKIER